MSEPDTANPAPKPKNFFPVRVPVIGILLAERRPSQLPFTRTLTPISAWSCSIFSPGLRPLSPATLVKSSTPPGLPKSMRVQPFADLTSVPFRVFSSGISPLAFPYWSCGLLKAKAKPMPNTRTLSPILVWSCSSLVQPCAPKPLAILNQYRHHQNYICRAYRSSSLQYLHPRIDIAQYLPGLRFPSQCNSFKLSRFDWQPCAKPTSSAMIMTKNLRYKKNTTINPNTVPARADQNNVRRIS